MKAIHLKTLSIPGTIMTWYEPMPDTIRSPVVCQLWLLYVFGSMVAIYGYIGKGVFYSLLPFILYGLPAAYALRVISKAGLSVNITRHANAWRNERPLSYCVFVVSIPVLAYLALQTH